MSSKDVEVILIDEPTNFPLPQMSQETPSQFAHCVIRKGYFDQMLDRIERHKNQQHKAPLETELEVSESIILEIERWDGKPFRL